MVLEWLWPSKSSTSDAISNLDPSLREVLKKQESASPIPIAPAKAPKDASYVADLVAAGVVHDYHDKNPQKPKVPPQSLYQDGRYAHLWKNYEPQLAVEARGDTEVDRLKKLDMDLKHRKTHLGQVALENCAFEQWAELDCLKNGSTLQKLSMCRPEKKKFNRCYDMQVKFLKALGFFEAIGDDKRADAIQMHSDKLWHRLVEQEEQIEKAKEEGRELPNFESILSAAAVQSVGGTLSTPQIPKSYKDTNPSYAYPNIPEPAREEFNKKIDGLSPEDANVEAAVFLAEIETRRRTGGWREFLHSRG